MFQQTPLQMPLVSIGTECEKIEVVRVLQNLLCQIGLRWRQGAGKICLRLTLPSVQVSFNLMLQNRPAPAVLVRGMNVPEPLIGIFDLVQQPNEVPPGQCEIVQQVLDDCSVRVGLCKCSHIKQICPGKSRNTREGRFEVCC